MKNIKKPVRKITIPTPEQLAQLKRSAKKAARWSYEKQLEFLQKYPKDFENAIELMSWK